MGRGLQGVEPGKRPSAITLVLWTGRKVALYWAGCWFRSLWWGCNSTEASSFCGKMILIPPPTMQLWWVDYPYSHEWYDMTDNTFTVIPLSPPIDIGVIIIGRRSAYPCSISITNPIDEENSICHIFAGFHVQAHAFHSIPAFLSIPLLLASIPEVWSICTLFWAKVVWPLPDANNSFDQAIPLQDRRITRMSYKAQRLESIRTMVKNGEARWMPQESKCGENLICLQMRTWKDFFVWILWRGISSWSNTANLLWSVIQLTQQPLRHLTGPSSSSESHSKGPWSNKADKHPCPQAPLDWSMASSDGSSGQASHSCPDLL